MRSGSCWSDRVVKKIGEYAPNVPKSIIARQVLTPLDLERTYGLTEGNIFHGGFVAGAAVFYAAGGGVGAVQDAGGWTLFVWGGGASGGAG